MDSYGSPRNSGIRGLFPDAVKDAPSWDYVLLSAIDYCFPTENWDRFLKDIHAHLQIGGRCLLVSVSLNRFPGFHPLRLARAVKNLVRWVLHALGIAHRGHWWGYCRSRAEYRQSFVKAGLSKMAFYGKGQYWTEARKS